MKFTRRKFLQSVALVCTAPAINKIDAIASVNADACLEIIPIEYRRATGPGSWYNFLEENLSEDIQKIIFDKIPDPFNKDQH